MKPEKNTSKHTKNVLEMEQIHFLFDIELSWKAKGLLTYILRNNLVTFTLRSLSRASTDGRDSTRTAFAELVRLGYAREANMLPDEAIHHLFEPDTDYTISDTRYVWPRRHKG